MWRIFRNFQSFLIGIGEFIKKSPTVEYRTDNEERIPDFERVRGELILNLPECIGCGICVETCPNNALKMVDYDSENPKNKKKRAPHLDLGMCSFCGLCVEQCPYDVLHHGTTYDKAYLTMADMHRTPHIMYEDWVEQRGEEEEDETIEVEVVETTETTEG